MQVLVDTSVWIDYFRGDGNADDLDFLIDENLLVTNEIILAELLPFLSIKGEFELISLLQSIRLNKLDVQWHEIIDYQVRCLKNGASGIGIPDLIIAQNALQNDCLVYTLVKHFDLMSSVLHVGIYKGME